MKWSPVSMALRTTLFNNLGISAGSSFSLYGINDKGHPVKRFALEENGKLMRLTNFSASLDFDLGEFLRGDRKKQGSPNQGGQRQGRQTPENSMTGGKTGGEAGAKESIVYDEFGYAVFDVPWSMRVSYNFNYSKPVFKSTITQTLSFSGNVTLTKKTAITYTSGYDFTHKEITMTNIGITRDLHCWTMSLNWVPNGTMKMWNFTIRVKASVLGDLKYERRRITTIHIIDNKKPPLLLCNGGSGLSPFCIIRPQSQIQPQLLLPCAV